MRSLLAGGGGLCAEPQVAQVADLSGGDLQALEGGPAGAADAQVQGGAVRLAGHESLGAEAAVLIGGDPGEDPQTGVVVGGELTHRVRRERGSRLRPALLV